MAMYYSVMEKDKSKQEKFKAAIWKLRLPK